MTSAEIFYCTLGMCIVSYIPRVLPPFVLLRMKLSPVLACWLKYVPTSVFGALVFSEIFIGPDHTFNFKLDNINLLASLFVLAVAVRTHSLAKSIVVGLIAFWILQRFLPH
jgi:branched-subunit amino acid transport protein